MTTETMTTQPAGTTASESESKRSPIEHVAIIVSKGTLDMAYPGLILANAARMSGIDATLFFTFWGLDVVTERTIDNLHVPTVGNPSMHIPTFVGGLPGMESLATNMIATNMMKKQMEKLDIPPVREMIEILGDSGAKLYACQMAMDMFKRSRGKLAPFLSVGASYQTKTRMSEFDKYQGLFAESGSFDIPSSWVVGVALHPVERIDLLFDVQRMNYSEVSSVNNPLLPNLAESMLGMDDGAGFGWRDVTVYKVGAQVRALPRLTLRGRLLLRGPADPDDRGPLQHPRPRTDRAPRDLRRLVRRRRRQGG